MKISFKSRVFVLVSFAICLPVLILVFFLKDHVAHTMLQEKQAKLFGLARQLDHYLQGTFDDILAAHGALQADKKKKIAILNSELRNITDIVASGNPGVGVGYYSRDLNAVLTYGPSKAFQHTVGISISHGHQGLEVMATGEPMVQTGQLVRGNIMNCMWPIKRDGRVIGYIWSNETVDHVNAQLSEIMVNVYGIIAVILAMLYASIWATTNYLVQQIMRLKSGIEGLFVDPNRKLPGINGELNVIVDRINKLMASLNQLKSYTHYILNSIINGVLSLDMGGKIVRANPAFFNLFEHLSMDIIGCHYTRVFHSAVRTMVRDGLEKMIFYTSKEVRGRSKIFEVYSNGIMDEAGERLGLLLVFRDVTLIRNYEKALKERNRMAILGQMALAVAHEIKNPLTAVKGFAQMMHRPKATPQKKAKYLEQMDIQLNRVNRLLNEMLIYGGRTPLNLVSGDIQYLVGDVLEKMAVTEPGLAITRKVIKGNDFNLIFDESKITQVLDNVLQNAVYAVKASNRTLKIIRFYLETTPLGIRLRIIDNGIGIPTQATERIFDPFFTTKPEGAGFGLAICYKIIENHGGTITVTSKEGKYTIVIIDLPRTLNTEEA